MRRGRAGGGLRCGGDDPDRAGQLWQVQHRHLQRRWQDPLERELHVAQDPTHPSEQVRINFIIIISTAHDILRVNTSSGTSECSQAWSGRGTMGRPINGGKKKMGTIVPPSFQRHNRTVWLTAIGGSRQKFVLVVRGSLRVVRVVCLW